MKRFRYRYQTRYPMSPYTELTFTNKHIHMKYGYDEMYIYKKLQYDIDKSLKDIESLNLPIDYVLPETFMRDGFTELIYIDSIEIMDLNICEDLSNKVRNKILDIIGYDIFKEVEDKYKDIVENDRELIFEVTNTFVL